MTRRVVAALIAVVGLATLYPSARGQQLTTSPDVVAGEILVAFEPGVSPAQRVGIVASKSATMLKVFNALSIAQVRVAPGQNLRAAVAAMRGTPGVASVQPNYVRRTTASGPPNDTYWLSGALWGLERIGAQPTWTAFGSGDGSVVVADIDTGVNYNHPDLAANMWHNPLEIPGNQVDDDLNGYVDDVYGIDTVNHDADPMDDHGHGTHTSGTIAAIGNNGIGVVGVNWNAKLLACKFLSSSGEGTDAGAIECLNYVVAMKQRGENIRVTNNSWGGARDPDFFPQALKDAFDLAGNAGILNVVAAGNAGTDIDVIAHDPASFTSDSILTVAASEADAGDSRAGFSNYGPVSVDLAAPGSNILSTYGNGYAYASGTSMATPLVAGAAALLSALNPNLTRTQLKSKILEHVEPRAAWAGLVASGGRLNLLAIATDVAGDGRLNVALAANGGITSASSTLSTFASSGTNNGDRRGQPWGNGGGWADGTPNVFPDWLQVDFNGAKTINEIDVFSVQDNFQAPSEPTPAMTFSLYGLQTFDVQYWTGAAWLTVPGGAVAGNNLVWRKVTFAAVTTTKVRILIHQALNTWSRVAELEVYSVGSGNQAPSVTIVSPLEGATFTTVPATVQLSATASDPDGTVASVEFFLNGGSVGAGSPDPNTPGGFLKTVSNLVAGSYTATATVTDNAGAATTSSAVHFSVVDTSVRTNVALATNGGVASASSTLAPYIASGTNNGDRKGHPWGNGGGWADGTPNVFPDWLQIDFAGLRTIDEVNVFSVQDSFQAPLEPTSTMTFSLFGLQNFEVQYDNSGTWQTVSGGTIVGNNLVWRQVNFSPVTTSKIRVLVSAALNTWTRIAEVEAWTASNGNQLPVVAITSPAHGASFTLGDPVPVTATATDDGSIQNVTFYVDGAPYGAPDTSFPYATSVVGLTAGAHTLTAVATDDLQATTTSAAVQISVTDPSVRTNVALAGNGGVASASSVLSVYAPSGANNGDRRGHPWGNGGGWADNTPNVFPDWLVIDFNGAKTITEVDVFSVQDNFLSPLEPTATMTFTQYGLTSFEVQFDNGTGWQTVPGGTIVGNNLVWRQITFGAITTTRIRILVNSALNTWSRIAEVEAWTAGPAPAPAETPAATVAALARPAPPAAEPSRVFVLEPDVLGRR